MPAAVPTRGAHGHWALLRARALLALLQALLPLALLRALLPLGPQLRCAARAPA